MKINTNYLILKTNKSIKQDSSKLRGYFGNTFKNYPLLHNHYAGEVLYSYPLIQYKIIDGQASILGIEEGATLLKDLSSEITELRLSDSYYKVEDSVLTNREYNVSTSNKELHFKFLTPWLALNPKNHAKYKQIKSWKDKKLFLNKILIGNILSMCKGLGIIVDRRLYVKSRLDAVNVNYKGIPMLGFTGEFKVRFNLPDYCGLGKGVSQGFGTVKRIFDEDNTDSNNQNSEVEDDIVGGDSGVEDVSVDLDSEVNDTC